MQPMQSLISALTTHTGPQRCNPMTTILLQALSHMVYLRSPMTDSSSMRNFTLLVQGRSYWFNR